MIKLNFKKYLYFILNYKLLLILLFFVNCSSDYKYDKSKAISAINLNDELNVDNGLKDINITLSHKKNNQIWLGSLSHLNQQIDNFDKKIDILKKNKINLKNNWLNNIFYVGDYSKSFIYAPIITNNKIFTMDNSAEMTAYDLNSKKQIWKNQIFEKSWLKNYKVAHIGACNNILFAVAGINQIKAIHQDDGKILWTKELSVVFNSAPICDGDLVYIISNDNKTFALDAKTGVISWIHYASPKSLAILGNPQVALYKNYAILSYSSGEICAVNKKNGEEIWQNNLNLSKNFNSNSYLNDIDATPVIRNDIVYAIGNGGLMKAMSLKNGNDIWTKSIASVVDFWVAGDFIFVINNDNKLMAIYKKTGTIKWIKPLPAYRNPNNLATKYNYISIIMIDDKLMINRDDGELFFVSPFDGEIIAKYDLNYKILHAPAVINNKIYFYGMNRFKIKLIELE